MKHDSRQDMIEATIKLVITRGVEAASFSEILTLTNAPRGSIYYHFPQGKDQLIESALTLSSERIEAAIDGLQDLNPRQVTERYLQLWRQLLISSDYMSGSAPLAVTVVSYSSTTRQLAAAAFRSWRDKLTQLFILGGLDPTTAIQYAALLVSSTEGAVTLARAEQRIEPFNLVTSQLIEHVEALMAAST